MREIKFRAYCPKMKVKMQFAGFYVSAHGIGMWVGSDNYTFEDEILMQYTGLKDKNGVEIYQGDILKWDGYLGEVKWYSKIACFQQNMINSTGSHNIHDKVEVIGNIYENPELLQ